MNSTKAVLTEKQMTAAWRKRDAGYDGLFFFGVKTTGIFCRPSCPSQPKREHLEFFANAGQAVGAAAFLLSPESKWITGTNLVVEKKANHCAQRHD